MRNNSVQCILLEPVKQNVQDAEEFGKIVYLFSDRDDPRPSIFSEEFQNEIRKRLSYIRFDPMRDFLILTGGQIALNVTLAVIAMDHGTVNALAYHAPTHSYTELLIPGKERQQA